jgi:hypothetical protein
MAQPLDQFRLLGCSGLRLSPLSLGTMTFGVGQGWGAPDELACNFERGRQIWLRFSLRAAGLRQIARYVATESPRVAGRDKCARPSFLLPVQHSCHLAAVVLT